MATDVSPPNKFSLWKIASLGRSFQVGSYYDWVNDTFIENHLADVDFSEKMGPATIKELAGPTLKVFASDKEMAELFCLSSAEKLNVFSGLVTPTGSSKFFWDRETDQNSARVILRFDCQSQTICHQPEDQLANLKSFPACATHIVLGVDLGWSAFFVFEKEIETGTSLRATRNSLELLVRQFALSPQDGVSIDDPFVKNIKCRMFPDYDIGKNVTSFEAAIETIKDLMEFSPIPVTKNGLIFPLKSKGQTKALSPIGRVFVFRIQKILDEYASVESNLSKLQTNEDIFDWMRGESTLLRHLIDIVKSRLVANLKELVPKIRANLKTVDDLVRLLNNYISSGFSPTNFQICFESVNRSAMTFSKHLLAAKTAGIRILVGTEVESVFAGLAEGQKKIALSINSAKLTNKTLNQLKEKIFSGINYFELEDVSEWFSSYETKTQLSQAFVLLQKYQATNLNSNIEYLIIDDESETSNNLFDFYLHTSESRIPIVLPSDLPPPRVIANGPDWVEMALVCPQVCIQSVGQFSLTFCVNGECENTSTAVIPKHLQHPISVRVNKLLPGKMYYFRVQVLSLGGASPPSPWSQGIPTKEKSRFVLDFLPLCSLAPDSSTDHRVFTPNCKTEVYSSGGLRKIDIGDPSKSFLSKTILVVGATGTGKTTFLNSLFNFVLGVREEDEFRFKIVTQGDEGEDSSSSKTLNVTAYCLNETKLKYRLVVVDTPGFCDTKGLEADKRTTGLIKALFENKDSNGIDQLDAICIVVKASDSRLTAELRYSFDSIFQLFGNDLGKNIFIVATFCDASDPQVKTSLESANIDYSKFFKFNNSAIFEGKKHSEPERTSQLHNWNMALENFVNFFTEFHATKPVSISLSLQVLNRRLQLQTLLGDLHCSVKLGLSHLEDIRLNMMKQEMSEARIQANKQFTYTCSEEKVVQLNISGRGIHTTTCMDCNFTCCRKCSLTDDSEKAECDAMSSTGYCMICPSKCSWRVHRNIPYVSKVVKKAGV